MALSGSFYTNVNDHWRLQLEWTASQSISGNYSDVTAKLYWIALDQYGAVYSSANKSCSIYIEDSWYPDNSVSAALNANQKKLLHQYTRRIYHDPDGRKQINLDGLFNAEVTLSGTYYGTINLPTTYFWLDTIPRASSLTSSASFTAGNDFAVSISRASSSFDHDVTVSINGVVIRKQQNIATSYTFDWTTAELTEIFNQLNGASSDSVLVRVETFNGSTPIGTKDYTGTVTAPAATKVASGFDIYVYTDQTINVDLSRAHSGFTHTLKFFCNGVLIKTVTGVATSYDWIPTQAEMDAMHAQMTTVTNIDGNLEITTFYNGEIVRSPVNQDLNFYIRDANPVFSAANFSYADTDAATIAITGNDDYIVQNKSKVKVTIGTAATGQKKATIKQYIINIAGQEKILTAIGSHTFAVIDATANQTMTVKVVDSRGLTTTVGMTVLMVPYSKPVINASAIRQNNFESDTVLGLNPGSSFSKILVGGATKNVLSLVQYQYRELPSGTFNAWTSFTGLTTSNGTFDVTDKLVTLDNTKSWEVQFKATDKYGDHTEKVTVGTGKPLMFVDENKETVSINKLPTNSKAFEVEGNLYMSGTTNTLIMERGRPKKARIYWNADAANDYGMTIQTDDETAAIFKTPSSGARSRIYSGLDLDGRIELRPAASGIPQRNYTEAGFANYTELFNNGSAVRTAYYGHSSKDDNDFVIYNQQDAAANIDLYPGNRVIIHGDLQIDAGKIITQAPVYPTLSNGWANYGQGFTNAMYWKDPFEVVHMTGLITGGTANTGVTLFTLPAGYRPYGTEMFITHNSGSYTSGDPAIAATRIDISSAGVVTLRVFTQGYVSLAGISFKAEF